MQRVCHIDHKAGLEEYKMRLSRFCYRGND